MNIINDTSAIKRKRIGIVGAGSFGIALANLIAINTDEVLLYARRQEVVDSINLDHVHRGIEVSTKILATNDLERVAKETTLIFLVVPSANFRSMMKNLGKYIRPYHLLIHGTKGFDLSGLEGDKPINELTIQRSDVRTMSEVIREESVAVRIGCLSGPNLAKEIMAGQPAATVIASKFTEVIKAGRRALNSKQFHVFGSHEITGTELAGVFKNAIALGAGALDGYGYGKNLQSILLSRGLMEMIYFGKAMGAKPSAFIGTAGIGDLIATATSEKSRNYTFGMRLAQGESRSDILNNMSEVAEGVRTIAIMEQLRINYDINAPITESLFKFLFKDYSMEDAIEYLINYPYITDVDFIQ